MKLRVKICGITQPDQGRSIVELGATALGFICASQSPRYVEADRIRAIVTQLPCPPVDRIGVFVDASLETIAETIAIGQLSGVQLHGHESPQFCDRLRSAFPAIEVIKALRIRSSEALDQAMSYQKIVHTLLLDAYHPDLIGGTGKTLDWKALKQFQPECPWFLAGGLTPDNVLQALSLVGAQGIDLSSGVERGPGDKDLAQVARLFEQLRSISPDIGLQDLYSL